MCHFYMIEKKTKKNNHLIKFVMKKINKTILHNMIILAREMSFSSSQIRRFIEKHSDQLIIYYTLFKIRNLSCYQYDLDIFENLVDQIVQCFLIIESQQIKSLCEFIKQWINNIKNRCKIFTTKSHRQDNQDIFLNNLHANKS